MPIYEYQCQKCQHEFEVMQKITADPLSECPKCHGNQVQKLISESGFHLKGSGWYATDYKNKKTSEDKSPSSQQSSKTSAEKKGEQSSSKTKSDSSD